MKTVSYGRIRNKTILELMKKLILITLLTLNLSAQNSPQLDASAFALTGISLIASNKVFKPDYRPSIIVSGISMLMASGCIMLNEKYGKKQFNVVASVNGLTLQYKF